MIPLLALASTSWLGITLGEPYKAVYSRMGDPIVASHDNLISKFVYLTENENAFVTVLVENGSVYGVRLWALPTAAPQTADPYGVALNADTDALLQRRGKPTRTGTDSDGLYDAYQDGNVLWLYHLNANQTVHTITLSEPESTIQKLPSQPLPALHTGASAADAVVIDAARPDDTKRWEGMFLAVHPCGSSGTLREQRRETVTQDGRAYDALTVECSTGGTLQTLYFLPKSR